MLFSTLQVEGRMDKAYPYTFTPISQDIHIDEESQLKVVDDTEQPQYCEEECCGTTSGIFRTILVFFAFLVLCIMFAANHSLSPCSNPNPPKFFINSLTLPTFNISDGELSATWDVNVTISNNGMNSTIVNFLNLEAFVVYKEKEALAANSAIKYENDGIPGIFLMEKNETKTLNLKFATTGWESDQPIVDDAVLQQIAKDRKGGSVKLGLKILVRAELKVNFMLTMPIVMYPHCSDLEVKFASVDQPGGAAVLVDGQPRECLGPVEWGYI